MHSALKGTAHEKSRPSPCTHAASSRSAIRRQPVVFAVYLVLRLIVLASLVSAILRQEYESAFVCVLVLFCSCSVFHPEKLRHLPSEHARNHHPAFHLRSGDLRRAPELLHPVPLLGHDASHDERLFCAAVGFSLIDILNRDAKIKFTPRPCMWRWPHSVFR